MDGIIREPTASESQDFTPIVNPKGKKSLRDEFNQKLGDEVFKANKKGLPFAERACLDDFNEGYETQLKRCMKQYGFIKADEIKPVKIDWNKYSDLDNFEKIDEGEVSDGDLSKKNPGLNVMVKKVVYRYKGYVNKYTIMEDGPSAVTRAENRRDELRVKAVKK